MRPENPVPYVNQKGVVERDLNKKESYYVFQSYWTSEPMVHIHGHSQPTRWGAPGEEKEIQPSLTKIAAQNLDGYLFSAYLLSRTVVRLS